jgi:hypothetical protein
MNRLRTPPRDQRGSEESYLDKSETELALACRWPHPGLILLRESGLSRQEQWEPIEPVLRYLLERNDTNFMLNKVIEVEAPDRFSTRGVPPPFFP